MCCSQNPSDQLVVRNPRNPCAAPRFDDGKGLQGISCIECGARVSAADAARLLKAEEILEARKNPCFLRLQPPKHGDFSGGLSGGEISWLLPGRAEEVGCQSRGTKEHTEGASDC